MNAMDRQPGNCAWQEDPGEMKSTAGQSAELDKQLPASGAKPGPRRRRTIAAIALGVAALLLVIPILLIATYRFIAPPLTPLMYVRRVQGYQVHYQWVGLSSISLSMRRAVIVSEDIGFCDESMGIHSRGLVHQINVWASGGRPAGASTIAMQTTRNLFLLPGRSFVRKLIELWLTPQLALLWTRSRILEVYLNIIEFGPGIFGVQAAARYYFNKDASRLTTLEATRLAEVLPNPLRRNPHSLSADELKRADLDSVLVFYGSDAFNCIEP
jgi:monofunctional glycosyltransferase